MMLQIGDDGVVSKVDAEELIYVDKNELDAFVEEYNHLKEEKEQQQKSFDGLAHNWKIMYDEAKEVISNLEKENEQLRKELFEAEKELLWATSDEVDRVLHFEEEVEELRKEIWND